MISRREWLGRSLDAAAALALTPELLRAIQTFQQAGGELIQRAIPSTGEMLPVVGLSFSNHVSCANPAALREVFKAFVDNGGRVFAVTTKAGTRFQDPRGPFFRVPARWPGEGDRCHTGAGPAAYPARAEVNLDTALRIV